MGIADGFANRRVRHGAAAAVVVLATGGLFLLRANAAPQPSTPYAVNPPYPSPQTFAVPPPPSSTSAVQMPLPTGPDTVHFAGPHVKGTMALSNVRALANGEQPLFADVSLEAEGTGTERAPLAMVVVLDTSGSMEGEKIQEAKSAVKELVRNMKDDDDIAFVHYASSAEVVLPLSRVGNVRDPLSARIDQLRASGGTNIPAGLESGMSELELGLARLEHSGASRVRRVVLVSDGLDSSQPRSQLIAGASAEKGVTVSTMGIGLDFSEAYMGGVARAGHGNFGFVNDGPTLTAFLKHELVETATTLAEGTVVHLHMPDGVRFVKATGADADVHGRDVDLRVGAVFEGDAKRVLVEMRTLLTAGTRADFNGSVTWKGAAGHPEDATIPQLEVVAVADAADVERSKNAVVLARAVSVEASERQLEAATAYANGDGARAQALIQQNIASLGSIAATAPAPVASALAAQSFSYSDTGRMFARSAPSSPMGKVAAKRSAAMNISNAMKSASF
jgi:Ca-activated chloride channel family protein